MTHDDIDKERLQQIKKKPNTILFPINLPQHLTLSIWPCGIYLVILSHFQFHYISVASLPKVLPGVNPQNLQLIYQKWFHCVSEFWGMGNYKYSPQQQVFRLQQQLAEKLDRNTLDSPVVSHHHTKHMKLGHKRGEKRKGNLGRHVTCTIIFEN